MDLTPGWIASHDTTAHVWPCEPKFGRTVPRQTLPFPLSSPMSIKPPIHRRKGGSVEVFDSKYAVDLATQQSYSENVFLFIPNLIGQFPST